MICLKGVRGKGIIRAEMTRQFRDPGNAEAGDVLAFVAAATQSGDEAEVPASCLPVLAVRAGCAPVRNSAGRPVFVFRPPRPAACRVGLAERLAAALLALVLSPVFLAAALAVRVIDGAPVFFWQERYGLNGKPFRMVKFRTMIRRSERLHDRLQRKAGRKGRLFKMRRDPRVTRTGGFLRRSFLDELPQLFNVMRGEMRLVGPRPLPASDQFHYVRPCHRMRLKGVPGLTGLWQVAGRNERTFDEMCLLDAYYLGNRSAALDLRIIGRTLALLFQQAALKRKAECGGQ